MSWKSTAGKRKQTARMRGTATKVSESSWREGSFSQRLKSAETTKPEAENAAVQPPAIIAIGKKEGGGYQAVNVGKELSAEERQAVSQKTSAEGRQTVRIEEQPSAKPITQAFRKEAAKRRAMAGKPPLREGEGVKAYYKIPANKRKTFTFTGKPREERPADLGLLQPSERTKGLAEEGFKRYPRAVWIDVPEGSLVWRFTSQAQESPSFQGSGAIMEAGQDISWLEHPFKNANIAIDKLTYTGERSSGLEAQYSFAASGLIAFGASKAKYATQPWLLFTDTGKFLYSSFTNFWGTGASIGEQYARNPYAFIGSVYGASEGAKFAAKYYPVQPVVEKWELKTTEGTYNLRSFGVKVFGRGKSLMNIEKGRVTVGTPKADLSKLPIDVGAQPEGLKSPGILETNFYKQNLKAVAGEGLPGQRAKEAISTGQTLIETTSFVTKGSQKARLPKETAYLNKKGTKAIMDIARSEKGTVYIYGSFSRKGSMPGEVRLNPRDIDIHVSGGGIERVTELQTRAVNKLQEVGINAKAGTKPGSVMVKFEGAWEKAIEFKGSDVVGEEIAPDKVFGYMKEGELLNLEGIQFSKLKTEVKSLLQGVMRIRKTKEGIIDIYPPPKRTKDIASLYWVLEDIGAKKVLFKGKYELAVAKFKELYPLNKIPEGKSVIASQSFGESPKTFKEPIITSPVSSISVKKSEVISPSLKISSPTIKSSVTSYKISSARIFSISPSPKASQKSLLPSLPSPKASPSASPGKSSIIPSISPSPMPSPSKSPLSPSPSPSPRGKGLLPSPSASPGKPKEFNQSISLPIMQGFERGFNVFVRMKGVFKQVNLKPLSRKEALNLGSFTVANTPAATFKVKPASSPVAASFSKRGFWNDLTRYNRGREPDLFVEKPSRRIKTWGEKLGITFKGIEARRKW